MQIIDTKPIIEREKERLKQEVSSLKIRPRFTVISVGNHKPSEKYIANKIRHCEDIGIEVKHINLSRSTTEIQLLNRIIVEQMSCHSMILQLPLDCENEINIRRMLDAIEPCRDVDALSTRNSGLLFTGNPLLIPATPLGCMKFLEEINYDVTGKNVLILGRSLLVGKPLSQLLTNANATVTVAHSHSNVAKDLTEGNYDVVVSCVGKPLEFKDISAKVIIDCGINFLDGRMVGDIDIDSCIYQYATIPPNRDKNVRGGLGSLTCLSLLENVIKSYKLQGGC